MNETAQLPGVLAQRADIPDTVVAALVGDIPQLKASLLANPTVSPEVRTTLLTGLRQHDAVAAVWRWHPDTDDLPTINAAPADDVDRFVHPDDVTTVAHVLANDGRDRVVRAAASHPAFDSAVRQLRDTATSPAPWPQATAHRVVRAHLHREAADAFVDQTDVWTVTAWLLTHQHRLQQSTVVNAYRAVAERRMPNNRKPEPRHELGLIGASPRWRDLAGEIATLVLHAPHARPLRRVVSQLAAGPMSPQAARRVAAVALELNDDALACTLRSNMCIADDDVACLGDYRPTSALHMPFRGDVATSDDPDARASLWHLIDLIGYGYQAGPYVAAAACNPHFTDRERAMVVQLLDDDRQATGYDLYGAVETVMAAWAGPASRAYQAADGPAPFKALTAAADRHAAVRNLANRPEDRSRHGERDRPWHRDDPMTAQLTSLGLLGLGQLPPGTVTGQLGEDVDRWKLLFELARDWSGTLGELLDTVTALHPPAGAAVGAGETVA